MNSERNNILELKSEINTLKEIENKIRVIRHDKEEKLRKLVLKSITQ